MRRRRNLLIWAGFLLVVLGFVSYPLLFVRFVSTREIPWANALLFVAGAGILAIGVMRAYRQPSVYRGRISGTILALLTLVLSGLFYYGIFVLTRVPALHNTAKAGALAPAFTLSNTEGKPVQLADLLRGRRGALLIFYRGYW
jgi:hypothetical protein